jgi:restriction endonuclease S subunit
MAIYYSERLSAVIRDNRWAAEFHRPGYKFVPKSVDSWRTIGRCSKLCQYGLSIKMNEAGRGVPIYRLNEIEDCFLSESPSKYAAISPKMAVDYELEKRDLLFCRTNGNINYVGRTGLFLGGNKAVFASYLVRVRTDSNILLPEYLTIYLNTEFGRRQIVRRAMPSNQVNVSAAELKRIDAYLAPDAIQKGVADLVQDSYRKRVLGLTAYREAQQLLEAELGLDKLSFQKPVGYTTCLSAIEEARRFDSEHYFPSFPAFKAGLPAHVSLSPLSNYLEFCQRGKQPWYSKTGLPVINSKHVQPNRVIGDGNRLARPNPDANLQIRFGDTLLNGTGRGTIGRAAPYLSKTLSVADNHVTILRSTNLDPAYLALYLNSRAGQMQVEMHLRGSSGQLELYPFDIRKFLVWPAPPELQREIRRLHDAAAAADRESHLLFDQAKIRVEQVIKEAVHP